MKEMKTKSLLMFVAGMGIAGMLLMAAMAIFQLYEHNDMAEKAIQGMGVEMKALIAVETANVEFKRQVQEWKDTLLRGNDPQKFEKYFGNFQKREAAVDENLSLATDLLKSCGLVDDAEKVAAILVVHKDLGARYREALKSYDQSNPNADKVVDGLVAGMDRPMTQSITDFVSKIEGEARGRAARETSQMQNKYERALAYFLIILAAVSLAVFSMATLGLRSILGRLGGEPLDAATVAGRISRGDLSVRVPDGGNAHSLMAAMREMKGKLSALVGQIQSSVDRVVSDAGMLESSATGLEENSKVQSGSAANMAATMEEIATSIQQLSASAESVLRLSGDSEEVVMSSSVLIRDIVSDIESIAQEARHAVSAMQELDQRSNEISHIVQVIQEIAGQTNLLALNAAIEAARAGEQGRGFAVVADEVRKLAVRTSQSTQEIVDMIEKIHVGTDAATLQMHRMMERVDQSAERAGSVGEAMNRIQEGFQHTGAAISEISAAIREQSSAANEIAQNVEQVSQMSSRNYSASIDLHGAVGRIRNVADELHRESRQFTLA